MKTLNMLLLALIAVGISSKSLAQQSQPADSIKKMNLIDEQVKMYGSIFELAGAGESNPFGNATNYKQLIEGLDLSPDIKKTILEQYQVYDLSLDPKKKDSLKIAVNKMLKEAIEKSQNESAN